MASQAIALGKVICFRCRRSNCVGPCHTAARRLMLPAELKRVGIWLGGACITGSVLGGVLALLFGG